MWTYKNDYYYAVLIIVFPTLKKDTNKYKNNYKFEEKSRDGSKKKLSNKSGSDTRRHPYIAFMKSSSEYLNDDVVLDVSLYYFSITTTFVW